MTYHHTRRGTTQEIKDVVIKQGIIPERVSGSSTHDVTQKPGELQALKPLKRVQGLSYFTTVRGFALVEPLVNIGQVKPDANHKQAWKLSGSRLTYKYYQGFTLIELLVVVLIIGILAAVALPQYNKAVLKSQGTELLNALGALDKAQAMYYMENGSYTDIESRLDIDLPTLKYFQSYNTNRPNLSTHAQDSLSVSLTQPKYNLSITASWTKGNKSSYSCVNYVSGNKTSDCQLFFNCTITQWGTIGKQCTF